MRTHLSIVGLLLGRAEWSEMELERLQGLFE
jgi:hypothetical protein